MEITKRYLKASEAAEYMNVCPNTVRKYGKEWGCLVKIGRAARYDRLAIDARLSKIIAIGGNG